MNSGNIILYWVLSKCPRVAAEGRLDSIHKVRAEPLRAFAQNTRPQYTKKWLLTLNF